MNQKLEQFKGEISKKRIAIIGVGVSNLPLISYFKDLNCEVVLFDEKNLKEMDPKIQNIIKDGSFLCYTGRNYLDNLVGFNYIFRSPSFLPTNPFLVKEKERGAIVTTEIEQVIRLAPCKVIGVTGSKGKTTTTTIIHHILTKLGYHTYLGGNIGIPLFTKLDEMGKDDIVVLELSSFQLMEMQFSPNVAVITNISPDHLDVHRDYQEYIDAKKFIFLNQGLNDTLVLNQDDEIVSKFQIEAPGKVKFFGQGDIVGGYSFREDFIRYNGKKVIDTRKLMLKGSHNYLNICAALNAIAALVLLPQDELETIVSGIAGVSHRLEFVREIHGVSWYNDSASTTPDKTLAGLYAFSNSIVLIAGGYDKNISYVPLAEPILEKVSKLILFGDTKNKIYDAVMNLKKQKDVDIQIYVLDTLEEVVSVAYKVSVPGEVVLFSPASASFDMFKNAYQRGDKFKELVGRL